MVTNLPAVDNRQQITYYLRQENVLSNFAKVLGAGARSYVTSVLIEVANTPALQLCTKQSIYMSALRAATLNLSVDQSLKQAYLVPFKNSHTGESECTLIVGWKGMYDMAMRTNEYRYINATPIYIGEDVIEDRISGLHHIDGHPTDKKDESIKGFLAAFERLSGYAKTLYMDLPEIHAHASKHSKNYKSANSVWKRDPRAMEKKTVLRRLLTEWGYMNASDLAVLNVADEAEVEIAALPGDSILPAEEPIPAPAAPRPKDEILDELGYEKKPLSPTAQAAGRIAVVLDAAAEALKPAADAAKPHVVSKEEIDALVAAGEMPKDHKDTNAFYKYAANKVSATRAAEILEQCNLNAIDAMNVVLRLPPKEPNES